MRILVVEPGPRFSVQDVYTGWVAALRRLVGAHNVVEMRYADHLDYHDAALKQLHGDDLPAGKVCKVASKDVEWHAFEVWPDIVLVCSAFYVNPTTLALLRDRGMKVWILGTESPYEDPRQFNYLAHGFCDGMILNDPTNLEQFRHVSPNVLYLPHAYDPSVHYRRPADPALASDFCFVGTGYESRVEFFERVDWSGVDAAFGGNWQALDDGSPLAPFLVTAKQYCVENDTTQALYSNTKASANLYRRESMTGAHAQGWAMGPREVELAAVGTFYLTEARGENREVLPMVPTFDGPDDFSDKLRWWLAHDTERERVAQEAQRAIADRTFDANAKAFLAAAVG